MVGADSKLLSPGRAGAFALPTEYQDTLFPIYSIFSRHCLEDGTNSPAKLGAEHCPHLVAEECSLSGYPKHQCPGYTATRAGAVSAQVRTLACTLELRKMRAAHR